MCLGKRANPPSVELIRKKSPKNKGVVKSAGHHSCRSRHPYGLLILIELASLILQSKEGWHKVHLVGIAVYSGHRIKLF